MPLHGTFLPAFAGDSSALAAELKSWARCTQPGAELTTSLRRDFVAIPVYTLALLLAGLMAIGVFWKGRRAPRTAIAAIVLVCLLGGASDVVENFYLLKFATPGAERALQIARVAAWAKVTFVAITLVLFIIAAITALLRTRARWLAAYNAERESQLGGEIEKNALATLFADERRAIHYRRAMCLIPEEGETNEERSAIRDCVARDVRHRKALEAVAAEPESKKVSKDKGTKEHVPLILRELGESLSAAWNPEETPSGEQPTRPAPAPPQAVRPPRNLVGLALSGGGIRSATFSLGVLQGLHAGGVLRYVDYLSTVSGGGFTGGWLSAWLSRTRDHDPKPQTQDGTPAEPAKPTEAGKPANVEEVNERIFPPPEEMEAERYMPAVIPDLTTSAGAKAKDLATSDTATPGVTPLPEGSRSAFRGDAIHHLRLFANYLTPRTGVLSADTWRAITVVTRNLVLTWLVLLPVVFGAIVLAQLYFAGDPQHGYTFGCSVPDKIGRDSVTLRIRGALVNGAANAEVVSVPARSPRRMIVWIPVCRQAAAIKGSNLLAHREVLKQRAWAALRPVGALLIVSIALTIAWMLATDGGVRLAYVGGIGLAGVTAFLVFAFRESATKDPSSGTWTDFFSQPATRMWVGTAAAGVILVTAWAWFWGAGKRRLSGDQRRNKLVHYQSMVSVAIAGIAATLAIAGFGHEIVWWLLDPDTGPVAKAGGWGAAALAGASALYSAYQSAPSPKDDDRYAKPGIVTRIAYRIAPVLVLLVLAVALAWVGFLLFLAGTTEPFARHLGSAVLIGAALELVLATEELWAKLPREEATRKKPKGQLVRLILGAMLAATVVFVVLLLVDPLPISPTWRVGGFAAALGVLGLVAFRLATTREDVRGAALEKLRVRWGRVTVKETAKINGPDAEQARIEEQATIEEKERIEKERIEKERIEKERIEKERIENESEEKRINGLDTLGIGIILIVAVIVAGAHYTFPKGPTDVRFDMLTRLAYAGLAAAAVYVLMEWRAGRGNNDRAMWLVGIATVSCASLVVLHYIPHTSAEPQTYFTRAGLGLVAVTVAWVIGLGWAMNPNLISLHTFYRARLVRAYLGASNHEKRRNHEITETAPNDDVQLIALRNHERGGPYHLVNTTLNLVGGRDLTTAQRSAANFILSKYMCGSARTGYRPTDEYMGGTLQLGTAVAISGAAVSPNMGSATPSAALAMLMALFNVRIGFWAPTPYRQRWREAQPRIWPIYLVRESLSQTNDLGSYCYLTDGGHFDNTGLYALIERGCQHIIVVDDGADPRPCFADIGQAIRRCRIDFGTEITLGVDQYVKAEKGGLTDVHYIKGTIKYSRDHLRLLGHSTHIVDNGLPADLIWIKPVVHKGDSADVRQYRIQNGDFPQQTTADQWFDEAQFESYRKLGVTAAESIIDAAKAKSQQPGGTYADLRAFFSAL